MQRTWSRILKAVAIFIGSLLVLLVVAIIGIFVFIQVKTPSPAERFLEGYKIVSPDLSKAAYDYTIDSPMAFGSTISKLCILDIKQRFHPNINYSSSWFSNGADVIGWRGSDTLVIAVKCAATRELNHEHGKAQYSAGRLITYEKVGETVLESFHFRGKGGGSGLQTFELDSVYVDGDSIHFITTQSWDKWKYLSTNLGCVTVERDSAFVDTIEALIFQLPSDTSIAQQNLYTKICEFKAKSKIRTALFKNLPIRERLKASLYRKD